MTCSLHFDGGESTEQPPVIADGGQPIRSPSEDILDATCGGRGIWCEGQKENNRTLFIDKREEDPGFCGQPNRYYRVQPDEVEDFRDLPYADDSFDLVVFDPPHTIRQNGMADLKGYVTKKYGALHAETWQDDLRRGFLELFRVLRPGGTLIFKFADEAADFEEVLRLAPEPPLFGTRTKQAKQIETRWFVFQKSRSTTRDKDRRLTTDGGTVPSNPLHPKRTGSAVESVVIDSEPALSYVDDSDAEWHDAVTTALLTPTRGCRFGSICVVERDTPVEIKGCQS